MNNNTGVSHFSFRYLLLVAIPCLLLVAGCSLENGANAPLQPTDGVPGEIGQPEIYAQIPPIIPQSNDTNYTVSGMRKWYLLPDDLVDSFSVVNLGVSHIIITLSQVDCWIDSAYIRSFAPHSIMIDLSKYTAEEHSIILALPEADTAFFIRSFFLTTPVYVTVSNDWDAPQTGADFDQNLTSSEALHAQHPELVMTHFAGPYAFTDPTIPSDRKDWLDSWLVRMRDDHGDEIGLHIHPYCNFMSVAGVDCVTDSSFRYNETDLSGYTIGCNRYSIADFTQALLAADSIFLARGLGKPVSFRAGAWTTDLKVMQALENAAYTVDASGFNRFRGSRLSPYVLYTWLSENWPGISDTSQPYYPSTSDISVQAFPFFDVLEAPDNGILIDYISADSMISVFHRIWDGTPNAKPRHFSIGYHPDSYDDWETGSLRLTGILNYLDDYLAARDKGPVIYIRMKDLPLVWKKPEETSTTILNPMRRS
jgi:hypothetical protein